MHDMVVCLLYLSIKRHHVISMEYSCMKACLRANVPRVGHV